MTHPDVLRVDDDHGPEKRKPADSSPSAGTPPQNANPQQDSAQPTPEASPTANPTASLNPSPQPELQPQPQPELQPRSPEAPLTPPDQAPDPAPSSTPMLASLSQDPEGLAMLWQSLQQSIQRRIQPEQFETWFRKAALASVDEQAVVIAVQNAFTRAWLEDYYRSTIELAVEAVIGAQRQLKIVVDPEYLSRVGIPENRPQPVEPSPQRASDPASSASLTAANRMAGPAPDRHLRDMPDPGAAIASQGRTPGGLLTNSDVVLNPKYTFNNFVVGPCNRFGHAAAMGAAEQPGKSYNPFFLHGNVGVGKTHLLQGLCYLILERTPESRILYLSCETFVNHFISALENGDLTKFRNKYRNVDVLVVDDIHLLANKDRTQEEFFHTFNALYNAGKQIVLSSDSPPKEIPTLQERLVSRFKWGMVTEIEPPCFETRMAIVKRKSRDQGAQFPDDVVSLIAEHVENNVRELEGAVTRLVGYTGITGQPLTVATAKEALSDLFKVSRGEPTMEDIITVITDQYGVKQVDLQSKRRTQAIAYPRQIAMFLARHITRHSLEEIGAYFGGRDHSTVLYGVDKIKKKIAVDPTCKAELENLLGRLGGKGLDD